MSARDLLRARAVPGALPARVLSAVPCQGRVGSEAAAIAKSRGRKTISAQDVRLAKRHLE